MSRPDEMLRISSEETGQARSARVPIWRFLEAYGFGAKSASAWQSHAYCER
jgi:hypothetical protein